MSSEFNVTAAPPDLTFCLLLTVVVTGLLSSKTDCSVLFLDCEESTSKEPCFSEMSKMNSISFVFVSSSCSAVML